MPGQSTGRVRHSATRPVVLGEPAPLALAPGLGDVPPQPRPPGDLPFVSEHLKASLYRVAANPELVCQPPYRRQGRTGRVRAAVDAGGQLRVDLPVPARVHHDPLRLTDRYQGSLRRVNVP